MDSEHQPFQNTALPEDAVEEARPQNGQGHEGEQKPAANFLTTSQAAEMAGVSRAIVRRWIEERRFTYRRIQNPLRDTLRIPRADYELWLRRQTRRAL